jgi:hypothetical protein
MPAERRHADQAGDDDGGNRLLPGNAGGDGDLQRGRPGGRSRAPPKKAYASGCPPSAQSVSFGGGGGRLGCGTRENVDRDSLDLFRFKLAVEPRHHPAAAAIDRLQD